ncbi:hypothetical protein L1765_08690 [Microaerobacter geothermalis]|uniref:hypothetical protein n=1 Tax=Microaerobacter geothermalis TaxID=674972 RepID=UPI001F247626|nr:hypothetical protein [Microaerobacter geothermalis]MCF6094044.1 hypothetical protein [Microaerobacter geothermalis]
MGRIGFPVPEETLLTFSVFLVYTGHFEYKLTILISYLGTISAGTTAYFAGISKLSYPRFAAYAYLGGLVWFIYFCNPWKNPGGESSVFIS